MLRSFGCRGDGCLRYLIFLRIDLKLGVLMARLFSGRKDDCCLPRIDLKFERLMGERFNMWKIYGCWRRLGFARIFRGVV